MKKRFAIAAMLMAAGVMAVPSGAAQAGSEDVQVQDAGICGEWTFLADDGGFLTCPDQFFVLPDSVTDGYSSLGSYEAADDGLITITAPDDVLAKYDSLYDVSMLFKQRPLEEADLEKYSLTASDALVVGETQVLEFSDYYAYETNPLTYETFSTSALYTCNGYTDAYIAQLLTKHPWTVDGKRLFFIPGGKTTGNMDLNDGEQKGKFYTSDRTVRIEWADRTVEYVIQSISTDPQTQGNITLAEKDNPDNTLVLAAAERSES